MKQLHIIITSAFLFIGIALQSQSVGVGTETPDSSAILDITSADRGVLIPRMSATSRQGINNPAVGLMVFDSTSNAFYYFNGQGWLELLSGNVKTMSDADNDTRIEVEQSPDDDTIRLITGGNAAYHFANGRIGVINDGNGVFLGHLAGAHDSLMYTYIDEDTFTITTNNTFIGTTAGNANTTGTNNVAVGYKSLLKNIAGIGNIAIGVDAMRDLENGFANVALGTQSLQLLINGSENIAIGFNALQRTTGNKNTAVGSRSLELNTDGTQNVALGYFAGHGNTFTGVSRNTIIGYLSGRYNTGDGNVYLGNEVGSKASWANKSNTLAIDNTDTIAPLIYGEFDNDLLRVNGTLNINNAYSFPTSDGAADQILRTDGSGNVSWQSEIDTLNILSDADNNTKIQVEESANEDIIRFDIAGTEKWVMINSRLEPVNTGRSILIGNEAGKQDNLTQNANIFLGQSTGSRTVNGSQNIAIGDEAFTFNISGQHNIAIGQYALEGSTGDENVALGGLFPGGNNAGGSQNVFIGSEAAGNGSEGAMNRNVMVGHRSGFATKGNDNVFLGYNSGYNEAGDNKLYIENSISPTPLIYGDFANDSLKIYGSLSVGDNYTFPTTDGTANQTLQTDGAGNVSWQNASASDTLNLITDADNDTKIQVEESADEDKIRFDIGGTEYFRMDTARLEVLNSGRSVFIGQNAGRNDDLSNNDNVFVGNASGQVNVSGTKNVAVGGKSLRGNITGDANVAIGFEALRDNTGVSNTGVGAWALSSNISGTDNVSIGRGGNSANVSGNKNIAIGSYALGSNVGGSQNVAIGIGALDFVGGNPMNNTAIGFEAGINANGSGNVFIGNQVGTNKAVSNRLYIDNANVASPLIYGEFDNDLLRVNGTLNINNAFSLPTTDGATGQVLQTDGNGNLTWVDKYNIPVGSIQMYMGATTPAGWLICDGSSFNAATYPDLNTHLGDNKTPNFRGSFALGARIAPVNQGEAIYNIGDTGGEEEVTLTLAEMPSHSHGIQYREGEEQGSGNDYSDLGDTGVTDATENAGGGQAHNNMPPFLVVNYIIKAN